MSDLTVVMPFTAAPYVTSLLEELSQAAVVREIVLLHHGVELPALAKTAGLQVDGLQAGRTLNAICKRVKTSYALLMPQPAEIQLGQQALERLVAVAESTGAGLVYADFHEIKNGERSEHPLNDYQPGSVRDNFDFGALLLYDMKAVRASLQKYGAVANVAYAGWYDLRLKLSLRAHCFTCRNISTPKSNLTCGTAARSCSTMSIRAIKPCNWKWKKWRRSISSVSAPISPRASRKCPNRPRPFR